LYGGVFGVDENGAIERKFMIKVGGDGSGDDVLGRRCVEGDEFLLQTVTYACHDQTTDDYHFEKADHFTIMV
jgi:hypothetical protein